MSDKNNPYDVPDTGHVWDDSLRELTNPPPKWWMLGLHASWICVVLYSILYPTWPLIHTHTKGVLGWTSIREYKEGLGEIEAVRAKYEERLKGMPAAAILADAELANYTVRSAKVLFGDNCAACHGAGGQGNPGFPVLADDDWLYGGSVETIQETITNGRQGMMPAQASLLSEQEIADVTKHVQALSSGGEHEPGKAVFMGKGGCFGCHGMDAKGIQPLGSANLTDGIWRFTPGTEDSIKHTITHGVNDPGDPQTRRAIMPTFGGGKLSDTDIKKLAVYVHELGGGQ